jgi:assimilatory nitrate reductase catalytic subunit
VQWPLPAGERQGAQRLFATGGYFTPSRRARLVPVTPRPPVNAPDAEFPLILNTGRIRDQWHTMTRTGKSARLSSHLAEPFLQLHPADAAEAGVREGDLARVSSRWGSALLRVGVDKGQRPGNVFAPMHWNDCFSAQARIDAVVNPVVDAISGEPEFKHTPVRLERCEFAWHAFVLSRRAIAHLPGSYWTRIQGREHYRYELAGNGLFDGEAWLRGIGVTGEWLQFQDHGRGQLRLACLRAGRVELALFVAADTSLPSRAWLAELFSRQQLAPQERLSLLGGSPPRGQADAGRTVCSCFGVGENTICAAIAAGASTPEAVTRQCKAGGNCGSCVPEIRQLIQQHSRGAA